MFSLTQVIIGGWIVFWLYWVISAFGSKRNTVPRFKQFFGARFGLLVLIIILFRFFNIQHYSLENRAVSSNIVVLGVGVIIFLTGLAVAIWARVYLGKNWGMPMTLKQNPELVTTGPYRRVRHPIYTGILLAMLGSAIASSIFWLAIFASAALYFGYAAVAEEKIMTKQFPGDYPSYQARTKMLVPFVF